MVQNHLLFFSLILINQASKTTTNTMALIRSKKMLFPISALSSRHTTDDTFTIDIDNDEGVITFTIGETVRELGSEVSLEVQAELMERYDQELEQDVYDRFELSVKRTYELTWSRAFEKVKGHILTGVVAFMAADTKISEEDARAKVISLSAFLDCVDQVQETANLSFLQDFIVLCKTLKGEHFDAALAIGALVSKEKNKEVRSKLPAPPPIAQLRWCEQKEKECDASDQQATPVHEKPMEDFIHFSELCRDWTMTHGKFCGRKGCKFFHSSDPEIWELGTVHFKNVCKNQSCFSLKTGQMCMLNRRNQCPFKHD
jgi:hypothetical protein